MPEMAVYGIDEEAFTERIPVVAPGVGGTVREHFEDFALRMIAPDAAAKRDGGFGRIFWLANHAWRRAAATPVEPTIEAPAQAIGEVVIVLGRDVEAVEH